MADETRDAFKMTPEELARHYENLGVGEAAHAARNGGSHRPPSGWSQPRVSTPPQAITSAPRMDARDMTPEQWERHLQRVNAGDLGREHFVGEAAHEMVEGGEESKPSTNARSMTRDQFRDVVAQHAPDLVHELFGPAGLRR